MNVENPLIIQSDRTLLLDVHAPKAGEARAAIMPFAELEKSPEHIHTYRISPLSLWNAAAAGLSSADVKRALADFSRYDLPSGLLDTVADTMSRYGKIVMRAAADESRKPEAGAEAERTSPLANAHKALRGLAGRALVNEASGLETYVGSTQRNKMLSSKALFKSLKNGFASTHHNAAAAGIAQLWEKATLVKTEADALSDENLASVKYFAVLADFGGIEAVVWLTVKESVEHGHRLYSLELLKKPRLQGDTPEGRTTAGVLDTGEGSRSSLDFGARVPVLSKFIKHLAAVPLPLSASAARPPEHLVLIVSDPAIQAEIERTKALERLLAPAAKGFSLNIENRGTVKWELVKLGWPVKDEAPLAAGAPLEIALRKERTAGGQPFTLRTYQGEARDAVLGDGGPGCGYGVVALPCGSGKTVVGMACMAALKTNTLILTTNTAAVHQWIEELIDKTTLTREQIAEYTGASKNTAPVTIATYQILTWRRGKDGDFPHFRLFSERPWGLVIYDEVHLLPAPIFRVTAELQATRRIGLTATLVREDGNEEAVFSLVGPKRFDVPWKELEHSGWIAGAICREIRIKLPDDLKIEYASAPPREKYRLASENPHKDDIVRQLVENHADDHILVIGQYIDQLERLADLLDAPLVTGRVTNRRREEIYAAFRQGKLRVIVVSKVANFAIDLPDASMAIQVSGAFGSRQEEAQRLGRILRPKERNSYFYTLVSRYTVEEDFAANRQKFLAEQGYKYSVQAWE